MAESAQIQKVSIKHDVLLDYLIANPTMKRSEVAAIFGVTQAWLSTIIHSCAFQEKLRQRQDQVFEVAVLRPIQEKLMGAANMAADRLMEVLPLESDVKTLNTVLDTTLANLGYGQKAAGTPVNQQNNYTFNISKEDLAGARALIGRVGAGPMPGVLSGPAPAEEQVYIPAPEQIIEGD